MIRSLPLVALGAAILSAAPALADSRDAALKRSIYDVAGGPAATVLQEGRSSAAGRAAETGFERERAKRPIATRNRS